MRQPGIFGPVFNLGFKISFLAILTFGGMTAGTALADEAEGNDEPATEDDPGTERVIVTGTPLEKTVFELFQSASVVSGNQLDQDMDGNLGQILDTQPGVATSAFGPGVGRPIIRGLDGDRVRILIDGIGTLDVSTNNPDHALAVDPINATSIEVVRGPATLIYGNNAIGGIVNVRDGRIPIAYPEDGVDLTGRVFYGTNGHDFGFGAGVDFGLDENWVFHAQGAVRDAGEIMVPGFLRTEDFMEEHPLEGDEEEPFKRADNTSLKRNDYAIGLTRLFQDGFAGISVSGLSSDYGLPEVPGFGEEKEIRIEMQQTRFDFDSEFTRDFLIFQKAKLRFGYADYDHTEMEDEDIGTRFMTKGWEGRIELVQKEHGPLSGAMGIQALRKNFNSIGEESSTPMTTTTQVGFFVYEEYNTGPWTLQGGARLDFQDINAPSIATKRSFTGTSLSGGASYALSDDLSLTFTGHRTQRAPNEEELFSEGVEVAAQIFKEGDPTLGLETATGFEASLKKRSGPLTFTGSFYYTWYDNFIIESPTDEEEGEFEDEEELRVFEFRAADARFFGGELAAVLQAYDNGTVQINLDADLDFVHAIEAATGMPLPRIPPFSTHIGGEVLSRYVDFRVEVEIASKQERTAMFEDETEGFKRLDTTLTLHPFGADNSARILVQGRNLTNAEVRHHTSFLKEVLPDKGRDVRVMIAGTF